MKLVSGDVGDWAGAKNAEAGPLRSRELRRQKSVSTKQECGTHKVTEI
jgi:hypothetical protein